ncbi:MAG: RNA polymerase sigma factor [Kofleriaceae bacterium]|nr:RNA polymerase sigma factor [Kofleriaceae bacterium]
MIARDASLRWVLLAASGEQRVDPAPATISSERLDACRRGDRGALDEVFRAHAAAIERLLSRVVGPRADVEDLLQETFAAAIEAFPRFRGEASVKTWLHRIALNVAHKHLRHPRHRRDVPLEDVHEAEAPMVAAQWGLAARLYVHLDTLDARKRIAFVLHVVGELPIAEIAALTGASKAATKSRIFWARRALLKRLERDPAFQGEPR